MQRFFGGLLFLILAGCGSGESAVQVTPVMADTKGTYRLIASRTSVTSTGGVTGFSRYSSGTLRLEDPNYTLTVTGPGERQSSGTYQLGTSVNTILDTRHGTFSLTSSDPPFLLTGSYDVMPDFTLTFNFDQFSLP